MVSLAAEDITVCNQSQGVKKRKINKENGIKYIIYFITFIFFIWFLLRPLANIILFNNSMGFSVAVRELLGRIILGRGGREKARRKETDQRKTKKKRSTASERFFLLLSFSFRFLPSLSAGGRDVRFH